MKKLIAMILSLSILTGCMNTNDTNDKVNEGQNNNQPQDNNELSDYNQNNTNEGDWYNNFETALSDKDFKYTSKEKLDASLVNGVEGYRYITDNGNIDIYRYEQGNNFDQIARDKRLTIDGKERQVEVNGNYVIVSDGVDQGILDIFKNMK